MTCIGPYAGGLLTALLPLLLVPGVLFWFMLFADLFGARPETR